MIKFRRKASFTQAARLELIQRCMSHSVQWVPPEYRVHFTNLVDALDDPTGLMVFPCLMCDSPPELEPRDCPLWELHHE